MITKSDHPKTVASLKLKQTRWYTNNIQLAKAQHELRETAFYQDLESVFRISLFFSCKDSPRNKTFPISPNSIHGKPHKLKWSCSYASSDTEPKFQHKLLQVVFYQSLELVFLSTIFLFHKFFRRKKVFIFHQKSYIEINRNWRTR